MNHYFESDYEALVKGLKVATGPEEAQGIVEFDPAVFEEANKPLNLLASELKSD